MLLRYPRGCRQPERCRYLLLQRVLRERCRLLRVPERQEPVQPVPQQQRVLRESAEQKPGVPEPAQRER